ncbi:hypothetical protein N9043_02030 [bacterium]|nr:hypothetical protein [bacterium]
MKIITLDSRVNLLAELADKPIDSIKNLIKYDEVKLIEGFILARAKKRDMGIWYTYCKQIRDKPVERTDTGEMILVGIDDVNKYDYKSSTGLFYCINTDSLIKGTLWCDYAVAPSLDYQEYNELLCELYGDKINKLLKESNYI